MWLWLQRYGLFVVAVAMLTLPVAAQFNDVGGISDVQATIVGDMQGTPFTDSTGPLFLGTVVAVTNGLGTDDVMMSGDLEVDGTAYLDGQAIITGLTTTYNRIRFNSTAGLEIDLATGTDALMVVGTSADRALILSDDSNSEKNHDVAETTNPRFWVFSATDVDSDNTEWVSMYHDQTTAVVGSGKGGTTFVGGLGPEHVTADPCGGANFGIGQIFYNSTSNYLCFCNGAGADIKTNDNTTACF